MPGNRNSGRPAKSNAKLKLFGGYRKARHAKRLDDSAVPSEIATRRARAPDDCIPIVWQLMDVCVHCANLELKNDGVRLYANGNLVRYRCNNPRCPGRDKVSGPVTKVFKEFPAGVRRADKPTFNSQMPALEFNEQAETLGKINAFARIKQPRAY